MPDKMMNRGGGVVVLRDGIGLVCLGWVGGGSLREGGGGALGRVVVGLEKDRRGILVGKWTSYLKPTLDKYIVLLVYLCIGFLINS